MHKVMGLGRQERRGFALLAVLFVLAALLILLTPFLLSARNADQASSRSADQAQLYMALDTAGTHARAQLDASHFSRDRTPYWDSLDEIEVENRFGSEFMNANDPNGVMWDLEVRDVAGLIDLNSAPPQLISNILGTTTWLDEGIDAEEDMVTVAGGRGLPDEGFLWIEGELVSYTREEEGLRLGFRGLLAEDLGDGEFAKDGPQPPSGHSPGTKVIDQRAFAVAGWRAALSNDLQRFDSVEQVRDAAGLSLSGELGEGALAAMRRVGTVYADARSGQSWQVPLRLTTSVQGGIDGNFQVNQTRWINVGSTVRISDGYNTEVAVVQAIERTGEIRLDRVLKQDYVANRAVVWVQVRQPVNVNTAGAEVLKALLENLQLDGINQRVSRAEAETLANLMVESRPFEGLEDLMRRLVLPAAGIERLPSDAPMVPEQFEGDGQLIHPFDALALYRNALNANDRGLAFSTMPFSFTTRDVYDMELRAAVNAKSGVERTSSLRERVELILPQEELIHLWGRQEDFDEALRLKRTGAFWMTGPENTSMWDSSNFPPSRVWPHMGTVEGQVFLPGVTQNATAGSVPPDSVDRVFAKREGDAFVALWPSREDELGNRKGRVKHFDYESRQLEGRYLPDEFVANLAVDPEVNWASGDTGLCYPLSFGIWVQPRSLNEGDLLLDMGNSLPDSDRVSLVVEGNDLVLRVFDGAGDLSETALVEAGEVRLALDNQPGLPVDTWSHLWITVRGTRPDQVELLVNGLKHGTRPQGLARLTSAFSSSDGFIPVDSVEGFPAQGCVRIGNELIEYTLSGSGMNCQHITTGANAGFGGNVARERWTGPEPRIPTNLANIATSHAAGTTVQLYGYSLPLMNDVNPGGSTTADETGIFRVGRVLGVVDGEQNEGDVIDFAGIVDPFGNASVFGMKGANSPVSGLVIGSADAAITSSEENTEDVMEGFDPNGGYAAIMQLTFTVNGGRETTDGDILGGIELVRYSGYSGNILQFAGGGRHQMTPGLAGGDADTFGGNRAFVVDWDNWSLGGVDIDTLAGWAVYIVPISLAVPGGGAGFSAQATAQNPELAQLTHIDDAELTEWVRYDYYDRSNAFLVRDDANTLINVLNTLIGGNRPDLDDGDAPPGDGGGAFGPPDLRVPELPGLPHAASIPGFGGSAHQPASMALSAAPSSPAAPNAAHPQQSGATQWTPVLGAEEPDLTALPVSRAVASVLQFRGVMDTFIHRHPAGTPILPVFRCRGDENQPDLGRPGRLDKIALMNPDPGDIGWPATVHRAMSPSTAYPSHSFQWTPDGVEAGPSGTDVGVLELIGGRIMFFGLQAPMTVPIVAGTDPSAPSNTSDTRWYGRLMLHPTGELPRIAPAVVTGGHFSGNGQGLTSAVVDELVYDDARFGRILQDPDAGAGGGMVLAADLPENGTTLLVGEYSLRTAMTVTTSFPNPLLNDLAADGGLLRIGDEILAYESVSASSGELFVAGGIAGRGLLGTEPQPHSITENVYYLEAWRVSSLAGSIGAGDPGIPVTDTDGFPDQGTVLVGEELIHYTRIVGGVLEMPASSSEPGARDERGSGIFRGRFGTPPAGHAAGEAVILFPFRYWDRYELYSDAPELGYFGFELDQPGAFWRSFFWFDEPVSYPGVRLGVLARTDEKAHWDSDPENTEGLEVFFEGTRGEEPISLGTQSDGVQWRVFVDYDQGAFDITTGAAHGWKASPRLNTFGAFYLGPGKVLRSVKR